MNFMKIWMNIRSSFWFLPAIYGLIAIVSVFFINIWDGWFIANFKDMLPKQLLTSKDTAKKLYAALVAAILTMTTVSFSMIMVVLTTYATQFSPRTLEDFMKSRTTQHVLGVYCFGFIFALLLLLLIDHGNPVTGPFIMAVIAIICLAFFVYFIHHSARWIQVNNLIAKIRVDGSKMVKHVFQDAGYHEHRTWDEAEIRQIRAEQKEVVRAKHSGYIQEIQWSRIVGWAEKHQYVIDLDIQTGDFVLQGMPLLDILAREQEEIKATEHIHECLVIGNERTDVQDIEFAIEKIVEIALRAMSPSTNDPHTAVNCINRIGALLIDIGASYKKTPYIADKEDQVRIIYKPKTYENYLYKSFYQLRYYGKNDISVLHGMLESLYKIALVSDREIRRKIWRFHFYINDVIDWDSLSMFDYEHLHGVYQKLHDSCRESGE